MEDRMNEMEEPPPLPDSERTRSSVRDSRVNPSDNNWIPIWRRGLLPSLDFNRNISPNRLLKH